jgi:hypothetical protein
VGRYWSAYLKITKSIVHAYEIILVKERGHSRETIKVLDGKLQRQNELVRVTVRHRDDAIKETETPRAHCAALLELLHEVISSGSGA